MNVFGRISCPEPALSERSKSKGHSHLLNGWVLGSAGCYIFHCNNRNFCKSD